MPVSIVTCPNCNTTLKPKTPVPEGTRIKCPKCQTVFAVEGDAPPAPAPKPAARPAAPPTRPAAQRPQPAPAAEDDAGFADGGEAVGTPTGAATPKKKGVPLWVWLVSGGGALLLLSCCGCGIGLYFFASNVVNAGSGSVTLLKYAQVQKGMSEAQVKAILGEPSETRTEGKTKHLNWKNGDNTISVDFTNDMATDRSCHLLTNSGQPLDQKGFAGQ